MPRKMLTDEHVSKLKKILLEEESTTSRIFA